MEQEELLAQIAGILNKLNIPYIITGGMAVVVWGRPRFTADIDLVIELEAEKADDLFKTLSEIGEGVYLDRESMQYALEKRKEFNLIDPNTGLKVDFWILKDDEFDKERIRRRISREILDQQIFFSSPEDLILIKLKWYKETLSTRQLEDIESVLKIQKQLDREYLNKWAQIHGTLDILNELYDKNDLKN